MMEQSTSDVNTVAPGRDDDDPANVGSHRHPLGVGIGAVLAAGTAGATGGVLVGPIGAIVGAVVGAVAGGLGGQAIAELVDPTTVEDDTGDPYTSRTHAPSDPMWNEEFDDSSSHPSAKQASRETWNRLDQSSKDLLSETLSDEP